MKVVIDIPEILLDRIKSAKCIPDMYGSDIVNIVICVRDGTPYEERPHGEWLEKHCDYGVYYRCSNCHKMPPNYECDYKEGAIKTNFCPNCGADMRKE